METHEISIILERVEPLQIGVTKVQGSNLRPKGQNFLEKFDNTKNARCTLESLEGN
jgi:hypothetical protein